MDRVRGVHASADPYGLSPRGARQRNRSDTSEKGCQANFRKQKYLRSHEQTKCKVQTLRIEETSNDHLVSATESQPFLSAIARDGGQEGGREAETLRSKVLDDAIFFSLLVDHKHVVASIANAFTHASDVHPHPGPVAIKVSNITSS